MWLSTSPSIYFLNCYTSVPKTKQENTPPPPPTPSPPRDTIFNEGLLCVLPWAPKKMDAYYILIAVQAVRGVEADWNWDPRGGGGGPAGGEGGYDL